MAVTLHFTHSFFYFFALSSGLRKENVVESIDWETQKKNANTEIENIRTDAAIRFTNGHTHLKDWDRDRERERLGYTVRGTREPRFAYNSQECVCLFTFLIDNHERDISLDRNFLHNATTTWGTFFYYLKTFFLGIDFFIRVFFIFFFCFVYVHFTMTWIKRRRENSCFLAWTDWTRWQQLDDFFLSYSIVFFFLFLWEFVIRT